MLMSFKRKPCLAIFKMSETQFNDCAFEFCVHFNITSTPLIPVNPAEVAADLRYKFVSLRSAATFAGLNSEST